MVKVFSWGRLDRALSERAQSIFIVAAAAASLIFLNKYVSAAQEDFLVQSKRGPGSEILCRFRRSKIALSLLFHVSRGSLCSEKTYIRNNV